MGYQVNYMLYPQQVPGGHILPFLEVQGLGAVREEEEEQEDVAEMRQQDIADEVMPHSQGFSQNVLYCYRSVIARNFNHAVYVAKL